MLWSKGGGGGSSNMAYFWLFSPVKEKNQWKRIKMSGLFKRPCTVLWKRIQMSGECTRPCTVLWKRIKMSGGCTRPCTVLWKELKCLVDVQDHALYTMKKN